MYSSISRTLAIPSVAFETYRSTTAFIANVTIRNKTCNTTLYFAPCVAPRKMSLFDVGMVRLATFCADKRSFVTEASAITEMKPNFKKKKKSRSSFANFERQFQIATSNNSTTMCPADTVPFVLANNTYIHTCCTFMDVFVGVVLAVKTSELHVASYKTRKHASLLRRHPSNNNKPVDR